MFDEFLAHVRDMNQAILVNTNVNKSTEVNDVTDNALKLLANFQVFDIQDILTKDWSIKRIPEITTWSEKVCDLVTVWVKKIDADREKVNLSLLAPNESN